MQGIGIRGWLGSAMAVCAVVLAGCAAPRGPAPVEDRGTMTRAASAASAPAPGAPLITTDASGKPLPGIENFGKPGYYAVRPGDTIRRIGNETGQRWQDIARWNNLDNPDLIEVGQVLRVVPPTSQDAPVATRPVTAPAVTPAAPAASAPTAAASAPARPPVTTSSVGPAAAASGDEDVGWIWPAQGALIAGFDEAKNKGLDIGGKSGDAVLAAADGRVVYAGAGLRGYGNLIILKHNNTYLTAYAHNQALLVKEDQTVRRGQKIAEMGATDTDHVQLHFEIRKQGKPIDPAKLLPAR